MLRLHDPITNQRLLTRLEKTTAAQTELDQLRRELEQLRHPPESRP
jgi:AmiR/NasT family two-component response regulator